MSDKSVHNGAGAQQRSTAGKAGGAGGAGGADFQYIGGTCGRGSGRLFERTAEILSGLDEAGFGGVTPRRA